ncbi:MAG: hypothetical protein F4X56_04140 [Gammaproteobacteria bacterium]|nr:hypothetical protein [Gammaproteobacteria bacterium]MYC25092.1 hypothetical protein [Gammaproteobacteria bacterium]
MTQKLSDPFFAVVSDHRFGDGMSFS